MPEANLLGGPAGRGRGFANFLAILDALVCAQPGGENALLETLERLLRQVRHRSQFILLTDAFVEMDALEKLLLALSTRGHQLLILHVLAPEELTFPFRDGTRFESLGRLMSIHAFAAGKSQ